MRTYALKSIMLVCVGFTIITMTGCTQTIPPGHVGIKINLYGSERGVDEAEVLNTGRYWLNPITTDIVEYPTFMQTETWTESSTEGSPNNDEITFNSKEGPQIRADIAISYKFNRDLVPQIFQEFRVSKEELTDTYIRGQVRDAFSRIASMYSTMELLGEKKQEFLIAVKDDLNKKLIPKGIEFDMVSIVGRLRVDERIEQSINMTIEATQRAIEAENMVRAKEAEAQQVIAEAKGRAESMLLVANAQAEANKIVSESITSRLILYNAAEKWDGILPKFMSADGRAVTPFIDLQKFVE